MDPIPAGKEPDPLTTLVLPLVESRGLELVELSLGSTHLGRTLRLVVDRPGGVKLEDCESLSKALGPLLEASPELDGRYFLEVSSAGLERPLRTADDFERFRGKEAKVKVKDEKGTRTLQGRLEGVNEGCVSLALEGGELEQMRFEDIVKARLVFKFGGKG